MIRTFKLITEANTPNYNAVQNVVIKEEVDKNGLKKSVTEIAGPFIQCEVKNRNGRIYPKELMEEVVQKYVNDRMSGQKLRSYGELGHPEGVEINAHRISHIITELTWHGNDVFGRAKILDTEYGRIAETLIKADGQLGVSSRGMGALNTPSELRPSLYENAVSKHGADANIVTEFDLIAEDIVIDPSGPTAFVQGIYESKEYILVGGEYKEEILQKGVKAYDALEKALRSLPNKDRDNYILESVNKWLKSV